MVSETSDVFYLNAPKMFGHNMSATKSSKKSIWPWPPIYSEKSSHQNYNYPPSQHRTSVGSTGSKSSNNKYKANEIFHNTKNTIYNNKEINFNPFPFKCSDREYTHYPAQQSNNYSKKEKQYIRNGRSDTKYSEKSNCSSNHRSRLVELFLK